MRRSGEGQGRERRTGAVMGGSTGTSAGREALHEGASAETPTLEKEPTTGSAEGKAIQRECKGHLKRPALPPCEKELDRLK